MREIFIAFRTRSQAMWFYEQVQSYRLPAKIINTPKEAMAGCGLAVKMLYRDLNRAKIILQRGNFSSLVGIFAILADGTIKIVMQ
ncbi:MAG TPA: DUF3343 domain-containing protein [Clostridia bacterium]|nr:DUF3343 domain-containing protein [Clostridia bacterium]